MTIETIGEALLAGWRVRARCALGKRDGLKSIRECHRAEELDLPSLVWTRGRNCPIASLGERMMCPACGSRKVRVTFEPPSASGFEPQPAKPDRFTDLPATVDHFGVGGSVRRRLAAAVHPDIARGAFEAAIAEVPLEAGEWIALREGNRLLEQHPAPECVVECAEDVNAEIAALRAGVPQGRARRWK